MRNASAFIAIIGIWIGVCAIVNFLPANSQVFPVVVMIATFASTGFLAEMHFPKIFH